VKGARSVDGCGGNNEGEDCNTAQIARSVTDAFHEWRDAPRTPLSPPPSPHPNNNQITAQYACNYGQSISKGFPLEYIAIKKSSKNTN
jgi:hypothetical protein